MEKARFILSTILISAIIFTGCSDINNQAIGETEVLPDPSKQRAKRFIKSSDFDSFADEVVENGIIDNGQVFLDPAGTLGNTQVLDPFKVPVTGLGGGFLTLDMGKKEAIKNREGADFLIVEADGSLLAAGFGAAESMKVLGSNDPDGPFVEIGSSVGSGLFDLENSGLNKARYLKIEDTQGDLPSGLDLQGVIAIHVEKGDLSFTPSSVSSADGRDVSAKLRIPGKVRIKSAKIVLATYIGEPSPTSPPYYSDLEISATIKGNGKRLKFDSADFFSNVPSGNEIIIGVLAESYKGDSFYLFDLISVN